MEGLPQGSPSCFSDDGGRSREKVVSCSAQAHPLQDCGSWPTVRLHAGGSCCGGSAPLECTANDGTAYHNGVRGLAGLILDALLPPFCFGADAHFIGIPKCGVPQVQEAAEPMTVSTGRGGSDVTKAVAAQRENSERLQGVARAIAAQRRR